MDFLPQTREEWEAFFGFVGMVCFVIAVVGTGVSLSLIIWAVTSKEDPEPVDPDESLNRHMHN